MENALVVVAHPDDEALWMGGKIMRENRNWTIICLTNGDNPIRKPRFLEVCKELRAKPIIFDLEDDPRNPHKRLSDLSEIIEKIKPFTEHKKFEAVFTHGENGEYGHVRHLETNKAIRKMIEEGSIDCNEFFEFDYLKKDFPLRTEPNPKAGEVLKLTEKEFEKKKELISKFYCFDEKSFEARNCLNTEAFRKILFSK